MSLNEKSVEAWDFWSENLKDSPVDGWMEKLEITKQDWHYRGEGNANIVLSLPQELKVVRLSKSPSLDDDSDDDNESDKKCQAKVRRDEYYCNKVLRPILGTEFVSATKVVQVEKEEIKVLNELLTANRPGHRKHKTLNETWGTVHEDLAKIYAYGSNMVDFCVEIKPKEGCWAQYLRNDDNYPKLCVYCLNQYSKLQKGKITKKTEYCPLDLFSGEPSRMIKAVTGLIQNPQNNFRLFKDGTLLYGENATNWEESMAEFFGQSRPECQKTKTENFLYLVCAALLRPFSNRGDFNKYQKVLSKFKELLCQGGQDAENDLQSKSRQCQLRRKSDSPRPTLHSINMLQCPQWTPNESNKSVEVHCFEDVHKLPDGSVLSRVLQLQQLSNKSGPSIYQVYQKMCPIHSSQAESSHLQNNTQAQVGKMTRSAEMKTNQYFSEGTKTSECLSRSCLQKKRWPDELDLSSLSESDKVCLKLFLLAATAKDCSILLTFSRLSEKNQDDEISCDDQLSLFRINDLFGNYFLVKVGVADLDPKPVSCIVKHYLKHKTMLKAYQNFIAKYD